MGRQNEARHYVWRGAAVLEAPLRGMGRRSVEQKPAMVRGSSIGQLRERRQRDELHFKRGKEEEVTMLRMLDSITCGRMISGTG
jgi:hypothetical protein